MPEFYIPQGHRFGISNATREIMSAIYNYLTLNGETSHFGCKRLNRAALPVQTWGKSHMELRVGTQFVRF
jgi:hypothetical protein